MNTEEKPRRTRLPPKERRNMILDHAADLIAKEGMSRITLDRLAGKVGVSKSLIYNHFTSVEALFQALYHRENTRLRGLQAKAAENSETLEQLIRNVTRVYLGYIDQRGTVLEKLHLDPSIGGNGDPTEYARQPAVEYFAEILSRSFGVGMDIARPAVDISFGLPAAAGHHLNRNDVSRQMIEDITVIMILAAIEAISTKYNVSFKKLSPVKPNRRTEG